MRSPSARQRGEPGPAVGRVAGAGPLRSPRVTPRAEGVLDPVGGFGVGGVELVEELVERAVDLPRGHHDRAVHPLGDERRARRAGVGSEVADGSVGMLDQVPQRGTPHRVDHEVDARDARRVQHTMALPRVEHPRLPGVHVHPDVAAPELDRRIGHDGHVHPEMVTPVVVGVDVGDELTFLLDAHETAAPDDGVEPRDQPARVGQRLEVRSRQHVAARGVVARVSVDRDERHRGVAGRALRMGPPDLVAQAGDLGRQRLGVDGERKLDEWIREAHQANVTRAAGCGHHRRAGRPQRSRVPNRPRRSRRGRCSGTSRPVCEVSR